MQRMLFPASTLNGLRAKMCSGYLKRRIFELADCALSRWNLLVGTVFLSSSRHVSELKCALIEIGGLCF